MVDLPKFVETKEKCTCCNSSDTVLKTHELNTTDAKSHVRCIYYCNVCKKDFGFDYFGGLVTKYVEYQDKVRAELSAKTTADS